MTREEVLQESIRVNSQGASINVVLAQSFIANWCLHNGKNPDSTKLLVMTATRMGFLLNLYLDALEMAEKEFSINKLYAAQSMLEPQGSRRLLQIF